MTHPLLHRTRYWAILASVTLFFLALDQAVKWETVRTLGLNESWAPIPALARIFTITHIQNTGVENSVWFQFESSSARTRRTGSNRHVL